MTGRWSSGKSGKGMIGEGGGADRTLTFCHLFGLFQALFIVNGAK